MDLVGIRKPKPTNPFQGFLGFLAGAKWISSIDSQGLEVEKVDTKNQQTPQKNWSRTSKPTNPSKELELETKTNNPLKIIGFGHQNVQQKPPPRAHFSRSSGGAHGAGPGGPCL